MNAARAHEDATVAMLTCPQLAEEYLSTALEEINESGGEAVFLAALRQVAMARGRIAQVAQATGMQREAVSRALSRRGIPTLKTRAAICKALGVKLDAHHSSRIIGQYKI